MKFADVPDGHGGTVRIELPETVTVPDGNGGFATKPFMQATANDLRFDAAFAEMVATEATFRAPLLPVERWTMTCSLMLRAIEAEDDPDVQTVIVDALRYLEGCPL